MPDFSGNPGAALRKSPVPQALFDGMPPRGHAPSMGAEGEFAEYCLGLALTFESFRVRIAFKKRTQLRYKEAMKPDV